MTDRQTTAVPPPETMPTQVPASALPYWQTVLAGVEQANQELVEIGRLEQQIARLRQSVTARVGAYESYAQHLFAQLGLGPTDRIEADGQIVRSSSASNGTA